LPLVVASTFVLDYASAGAEKVNVKAALDAAVVAAVNNNSLTPIQKEAYAKTHFEQNYSGAIKLNLLPKAIDGRVEMSASGLSPVTVAEVLGIEGVKVYEKSAAEQTSENVICVLALAPTGDARISFSGKVQFRAPTCSVHANSTNTQAIWSSGSHAPIANSFCSSGGSRGRFQPFAKGECAPIEDPYKYHVAPANGPCVNIGSISDVRDDPAVDPETGLPASSASESFSGGGKGGGKGGGAGAGENLTGNNVDLPPGTYCGGLTVDGVNVDFMPGNHIILDGPLVFRNNADATAHEVTFIMKGRSSLLNIESGASVDLRAAKTGPLAGLAIFQDASTVSDGSVLPNGLNYLASGGSLDVTGTVYFPTQTVEVAGQSAFGSNAPATSFIAYNVDFYGGPSINISVDHQQAGLPPVLPRTEDGARLVE